MSITFVFSASLLVTGAIAAFFTIRAYCPEVFGLSGIKSEKVENQLRDGTSPSYDFVDRLEKLP